MARGWESKSVESQKEDAKTDHNPNAPLSREEVEIATQRRSLERSRTRVERELAATQSELRRKSLRLALEHLDGELEKLGRS